MNMDIEVHSTINKIITFYHLLGIWKHEEKSNYLEWGRKLLLLILSVSFVISLVSGVMLSDKFNESIFLSAGAIGISVITLKLCYILWRKDNIFYFLRNIAVHRVNRQEFTQVGRKLKIFMNLISIFCCMLIAEFFGIVVLSLPIFSNKENLPINIGLPFDWRNNDIGFWMAFAYLTIVMIYHNAYILITLIIWYIMLNCSIKYQILEIRLKDLGTSQTKITTKTLRTEKPNLFLQKLIELIEVHRSIHETIEQFMSCFDKLFFAQISTSGICICCSVYALAFSSDDNFIQSIIYSVHILYNFLDIFMITYLGNEIKLFSQQLSYGLFQSNWINQSKSCKKSIIILMEILKKPQELVTGLVYPLNLETFTSILKFTYSSFNILLQFK